MARPRCDPFDAPATAAAIDSGETTARKAYEAYASEAARPYARSTFELLWRRANRRPPTFNPMPASIDNEDADAMAEAFWSPLSTVKPRVVVTLSDSAALRARGASLVIFDPPNASLRYGPGDKHPTAVVMAGYGGMVTIEAMRFCVSHRIAVIALDWMRDLLSIVQPSPKASAATLRAQVLASPVHVARTILRAKFAEAARVGALEAKATLMFLDQASRAASVQALMTIEAQAARASWSSAPPQLQWRAGSPRIPASWKQPWLARTRADHRIKRYAAHPINAMLNAVFAVTAGRLTAHLNALGAQPAIGFLHADKNGRFSLAWDAIEPLRPAIERSVFAFAARHQFSGADFLRVKDATGSLRLHGALLRVLLAECAPSHRHLADAARFLVETIEASSNALHAQSVGRPPFGLGLERLHEHRKEGIPDSFRLRSSHSPSQRHLSLIGQKADNDNPGYSGGDRPEGV